jgi:hypothetical protein
VHHGSSVRKLLVASSMAATAVIAAGAARPAAFTGFVTKSAAKSEQAAQPAPAVTILFVCSGERSVKPWEAHMKSGDDMTWVLDPRSDVTDFRIKRKKAGDKWPFDGTGSIDGKKGTPAHGKGKAGTTKGTYPYDIEAHCRIPGGGMEWKKIDPDIIVDF